ncbi:MAG: carboxypeptidase-like regulatory domain-containing protein [Thermoanaerobaculia bacterium]
MRRFRALAITAAMIVVAVPARSEAPLPAVLEVLGTVSNAARPVANALVIALNLQDFQSVQTYTGSDGSFTLPQLRAGIYRIIAVKQGFIPAITTVVPTRSSHRVALRLDSEKKANRSASQEIWELRGSLPADVLRDLDAVLEPAEIATYQIPRFRGEMSSVTGVTNQASNPAYAQTAVGVQGRLGDSWQVGLRGNMQRFEDPTDDVRFGDALAESSVMSMEIRSSDDQSYRLASTKSSWTYADALDDDRQADVRAHNFEWRNGPARVQVRYFEQANLFRDAPMESNLFEVAGTVPVMQTRRNDLGVALRVKQETISGQADIFRTADLAANGTVAVVPSVILHYGIDSRIGMHGQEWAPRTGAEWKLTENTSLVGSAMVKVLDRDTNTSLVALPSIVYFSEDGRALPRYTYTFGIVTGEDEANRFSAIATITEVDEALRMIFADEQNQFWDGLEVEAGDVRRDLRLAYRRQFGNVLAVDVATTAGTAAQRDSAQPREKVYITGDLQSTFNPTRTTIAVSYRDVQQPLEQGDEEYRSERIHVRMAQSLYLPIDIKLLLGLELARAENSPYLLDTLTSEGRSKKYIGGLAVNF